MSTTVSVAAITRRVIAGQMLFTAGHALSTGGFLFYFANEFRPAAAVLALLQCMPEVAESAGLFVRPLVQKLGGRKWTWVSTLLTARMAALGVPLMAFPAARPAGLEPIWIIIGCVAAWYVFQGMAYVAFLSWLSDLVPGYRWGRFFAKRNIAVIVVMLTVPLAASLLRNEWIAGLDAEAKRLSYVGIFVAGAVLAIASIVPLLGLPNVRMPAETAQRPTWRMLADAIGHAPFRRLLIYGWWLSLAQGLTQAAFFKYQVDVLKIPVTTYYVLSSLMLGLQIPLTAWAGRLSDRYGDRNPLMISTFAVSGAMLFWLAARPGTWWLLFGAYAVWGLFGVVNLCGQNLTLRLAPPSDNTVHLALFRQIGGLLSGIAGLSGGLWLDSLLTGAATGAIADVIGPFQILFAVSFAGRATAALWLIRVPNRIAATDNELAGGWANHPA